MTLLVDTASFPRTPDSYPQSRLKQYCVCHSEVPTERSVNGVTVSGWCKNKLNVCGGVGERELAKQNYRQAAKSEPTCGSNPRPADDEGQDAHGS
jgi:hypothetical protein